MCLTPITISNPTRRFVDGISRYRQQVPCGCCKECIKSQQDDWFVRAYFEYQRVKKAGGDVWFPLLTYSEEDLPVYHDDEFGFHMPAFRRDDLKKFRDKLRVIISRHFLDELAKQNDVPTIQKRIKGVVYVFWDWKTYGLDNKKKLVDEANSKVNGIRYIACPEFGETNGRSHFHVLLFVPFKLTIKQMFGTREKNYTDGFLYRAWQHGYVSYKSKKVGGRGPIIESERGIQYAFKYSWKHDTWYDFYGIDNYKKQLKEKIAQCKQDIRKFEPGKIFFCQLTKELLKYRNRLKLFRNAEPRRSQSTYFGAEGLNYFANGKIDFKNFSPREAIAKAKSDNIFNVYKCVNGHIDLTECGRTPDPKKPAFQFNMPRYYVRKIFYNVDEYDLWVKTPFALEVASMRYDIRNKRKEENYEPYFGTYGHFYEHTAFYDINSILHHYGCNNHKELYTFIQNLIDGRSAHSLAVYDTVYRGIAPDSAWLSVAEDLTPEEQFNFFRDNALDFMLSQQSLDVEPAPKRKSRKLTDPFFGLHHRDFSYFQCFSQFDKLIELIEEIEMVIGHAQDNSWKLEEKRSQEVARQNVVYFNPYDPNSYIF